MLRQARAPRADYQEKVERLGLSFHTLNGKPYWNEAAEYRFESAEIAHLESVTNELHTMCLAVVERVVETRDFARLGIPTEAHEIIVQAWEADPPAIYGRFDFSYDGHSHAKLLEYNADTPTSLLEAAVIQWHWLQEAHPEADQFNSLWEGLIEKWKSLKAEGYLSSGLVHFGCMDEMEDIMTTAVMMDTASEAGLEVDLLPMTEIGWHHLDLCFVDQKDRPIQTLFKLYPWEWILLDKFGQTALRSYSRLHWIEPIWKMVLSNKAILAVLWEMFPDHPNLLPTFLDGPRGMTEYVCKPLLGREGANVTIVSSGGTVDVPGPYDDRGFVYQAYAPLPTFEGNHALVGSWVIDGEARGIGVRESDGPITQDSARFVPHYFEPA